MNAITDPYIKDLMEQAANPEPLHPLLRVCVGEAGDWPVLRHPLVYSVPYLPHLNKHINAMFEQKRAAATKALKDGDVDRYLMMHERPYRADRLIDLARLGFFSTIPNGGEVYWQQVGQWWIDSENVHEVAHTWDELWRGPPEFRIFRSACMNEVEKAELALMPDEIDVWHGEEQANTIGRSWTTSEVTARWFARRFTKLADGTGKVFKAMVPKDTVLAYFSRRGESEVLVDTRRLINIQHIATE